MTEKELEKSRKKYKEYTKQQKDLKEKKEELNKLKKSSEVIRYLQLIEYEAVEILTDDDVIDNTFGTFSCGTLEDRDVYIYQGSYLIEGWDSKLIGIKNLNKKNKYDNMYKNIETGEIKYIEREETKSFEDKNHVIYILPENEIETEAFYERVYIQTRREYFKMLTNDSESTAITKLKTRSRKLY